MKTTFHVDAACVQFRNYRTFVPAIVIALFFGIHAVPFLQAADNFKLPKASTKKIDFQRDIEPILAKRCYSCHGPDAQEGELRLDRRADLLKGGVSAEPAIVTGKSHKSQLILLVAGAEPDRLMPAEGKPLTEEQIGLLRAWIDQGSVWPGQPDGNNDNAASTLNRNFWSFRPLKPIAPPDDYEAWIINPIDAFIIEKLKSAQLTPSKPAERISLIRRLFFDILGLPPTPEEIETFANDTSPTAYAELVDRVLASPHYGERWARHWLDVVRFAETAGFETNLERPTAYR